jgi:hypothetical protein
MDDMILDPKVKEADSIEEQIHSAARIMSQAITIDDVASKKALQNAAKVLIDTAMARFDESIGASVADDDEE